MKIARMPSLAPVLSFPRKRESRVVGETHWIPAVAGMTMIVLFVTAFGTALGQDTTEVVTQRVITLAGKELRYTARAGFIPIRGSDPNGEIRGNIFYIAYSVPGAAGAPARPVTFVWNGGPGSNSVLVHLIGFGPRRVRIADDPAAGASVAPVIEDNQETWLEFTDLVFVDPIGTGFSRATKPEYAAEFYSVLADIATTTEFVHAYKRARYGSSQVPIFVAGESYGTWRAAGVAEELVRIGQRVSGVILISGGIPFGKVAPDAARTALFVPNRTAAAFYHKRLAPELLQDRNRTLAEVQRWAMNTYAPAWERRDSLSPGERDNIVRTLSRYTGIDTSVIDKKTLAMTSPQFTSSLLRDRSQNLGRYDMRLTGGSTAPSYSNVVSKYFREELLVKTAISYQGIEPANPAEGGRGGSIGSRWRWDQAPPGAPVVAVASGDGPPGGSQPWLKRAMERDSRLQAFVAMGLYDSLNSCADADYIVSLIEAPLRQRIRTGCYEGGHMMYDVASARRALKQDVAAFVQSAASR